MKVQVDGNISHKYYKKKPAIKMAGFFFIN